MNFNSRAFSQTYWIGEVWLGSAFLGVYLDKLEVVPYPLDEIIEAMRRNHDEDK
jgi:hypothetical protein